MSLLLNKDKFQDIENAFSTLKGNESEVSSLRKISDALGSITGRTIEVTTVRPESKNQECTVMSVYPDESVLDSLIGAIINEDNDAVIQKIWNDTTKWHIEIDTRILQSDMTPRELTALILHEVGHIIASNSIPNKISKIVRFSYAKTNLVHKQLLKDTFFSKLLYLPILNACKFDRHKSVMKAELNADKYTMQAGYGKDLNTAIDKIFGIANQSKSKSMEDEMKELYGFSINSLISLQKRQNNIVRKNFGIMLTSTPSRFAKGAIKKINDSINGSNLGSVTESAHDEFIYNRINKITNEFYVGEAFFNRIQKMKRIDPAEIDYIAMELNSIKSNDDKMMIVSYIYSKLDIIDYYIALIDSKNPKYVVPHTRESLVQMRNKLDMYRQMAINKKLPEISYGINIQWPEGYEG